MSLSSFRAGSGDYQAVRPLALTILPIPGLTTVTETYSAAIGNIVTGSIADLTTDSLTTAQFATPNAFSGLFIDNSFIGATGVLTIIYVNNSSSTVSPAAATQVNLLVF